MNTHLISTTVTLHFESGETVSHRISDQNYREYVDAARNGHLSYGIVGIEFDDDFGGPSPLFVIDGVGNCAHSHESAEFRGDWTCLFCGEFRRHWNSDDEAGAVL